MKPTEETPNSLDLNRVADMSPAPESKMSQGPVARVQMLCILLAPSLLFGIVSRFTSDWIASLISCIPVLFVMWLEFQATRTPGLLAGPVLIAVLADTLLSAFTSNQQTVNIGRAFVPFTIGCVFLTSTFLPQNVISQFIHRSNHAARLQAESIGPDAVATFESHLTSTSSPAFHSLTNTLCMIWWTGEWIIAGAIQAINFGAEAGVFRWGSVGVTIGGQLCLAGGTYGMWVGYLRRSGRRTGEADV
ncbi:hypothetical protein HDU98_003355 [Podochytrium sp. JEL0797]|nr:hypothetical protein HDU98_003355 [Podochytrium sp. JEL0797]